MKEEKGIFSIKTINMKLSKMYYLIFYKFYSFFKSTTEEGWEDWRALAMLGLIEMLIFTQLYVWITIIFREVNFDIPYAKISLTIFSMLITYLNYYTTLHNNKWKRYAEEFESFSNKKKVLTSWAVFAFFIVSVGGVVFAFYQMSLIDWSKYR